MLESVENPLACLCEVTPMMRKLQVRPASMRAAGASGFINATDCDDYLAKKGMPFRDAYKITGGLVAHCIHKGTTLEALPMEDFKQASGLFGEDVYAAIDLATCVAQRNSEGGPAPDAVKKQIEEYRQALHLQL